jgi:hypothetical protein
MQALAFDLCKIDNCLRQSRFSSGRRAASHRQPQRLSNCRLPALTTCIYKQLRRGQDSIVSKSRYTYVPIKTGRISITNIWHERIAYMDCDGNAQEAFVELCRDLEKVGWELEPRTFDRRYIHRNGRRWYVSIDRPLSERVDRRGFSALLADYYREKREQAKLHTQTLPDSARAGKIDNGQLRIDSSGDQV